MNYRALFIFLFFSPYLKEDKKKTKKKNKSRVPKGWENLWISYLLDSARFLVRRLGHLLVNPERLEKGYKETVADHEEAEKERGRKDRTSWKSPRRVITPRLLITRRIFPTGLFSRSLVILIFLVLLFP